MRKASDKDRLYINLISYDSKKLRLIYMLKKDKNYNTPKQNLKN